MRYFIEIAYKGTNYHGWQYQPNAITIQELINKALTVIFKKPIEVVGAGRTDAGVHAEQLYAHLDLEENFNIDKVKYKLNSLLPNDIAIINILKVIDNAHARFDAESRSYEYRIYFGKNPFLIDATWQIINKKLNVDLMNEAAEILLTYTDFQCFSRSNTDVRTYNCDVTKAVWEQENKSLIFYVSADRFLRNMVRAIVGTLIEVGIGKTTLEEFKKIIESKDRKNAGPSAPAKGLFLTEVSYPKNLFINE
ncbi:tRNA pseudouridine(38-40) synthase TruA [Lutibacter sp. A80]|uniref:tRNA pseudouridine(38-40) synthase TruA n=1 Tax=Lutibacter sp. A80 TaxID=2918453 RepID=UPI001F06E57F|nr:tRNA pseudouridine(38-40) synthase TruA [Lutibacter sp. A80]UMB60192.1 tRNA pseudouridine(38-40) synthase TruA [Lutibacter sp. A80]